MTPRPEHALSTAAALLLGPLVWAIHFTVLYASAGFGPSFGLSRASLAAVYWLATFAALAVLAAAATALHMRRRLDGLNWFARDLVLLALAAVLAQTFVLWILHP